MKNLPLKVLVLLCLGFFYNQKAYATHNRAGEITFEQIDDLTVIVTITTYTKTSSTSADRDSLQVFWGDGTEQFVLRSNGQGTPLPNDIKINKYTATHTYPGRATYTISFQDPNRVAGILNVNWPASVDVPFFLSTTFTFLDAQFQGINNSAILLQPPLDVACVGQPFMHNPNAYDPDGDSLAFDLVIPFQGEDIPVPDYKYPDQIGPGSNNAISLNPFTGEFLWDSPQLQGEYNIAIKISEYRNGVLINTIIRDMQILVKACDNRPPVIQAEEEICVIAGESLDLEILVNDPDPGQQVELTASGGPFVTDFPAVLEVTPGFNEVPYTAHLKWDTECENISEHYYQIVFRAVDNFFGDTSGLATLHTLRIKVVGPPPENLEAEASIGDIRVRWDLPYACDQTLGNYFQGFSVWRKEGSQLMEPDTCNPGLTGSAYEKIKIITTENENGEYFYNDVNLERGVTYCYRVQAEFAQLSPFGITFNRVESLYSNEVCLQVSRDIPVITKASVLSTDVSTGETHVRWEKPLASDLDTLENPGPYTYYLLRSSDGINFNSIPGTAQTTANFSDPVNFDYFDNGLNTAVIQYYYKIGFQTNGSGMDYGQSVSASTVSLSIDPSDELNLLTWAQDVPWSNYGYDIFRFNNNTGVFDSIASVSETQYVDRGLVNGEEYCYYVRSTGTYALPDIEDPIINLSQEACGIPEDDIMPCPPTLTVENICDELGESETPLDNLFNTLIWTDPNLTCDETMDVQAYNIYYAQNEGDPFQLVETIDSPENNQYFHFPNLGILGCYAVTALDEVGNESAFSNTVCVDNCPLYKLPNTFTPNLDGANDAFKPLINRFVAEVDFKVYNRWGNLVYETNDPVINWDGKNRSGNELADGVYYYTCKVYELRVAGIVTQPTLLRGYIQIIRGT